MPVDIARWNEASEGPDAIEVLAWAADEFGDSLAFATAMGLEDQVLVDMIARTGLDIPVFTLDTGRLHQETHELIERTRVRYGIKVRVYFPDADDVEELVTIEGPEAFRRSIELRKRCCEIRKLKPLGRALAGLEAWVCGLRRAQSVTRTDVSVAELDEATGRTKISPLAHWSEEDVRQYVSEHDVPYNSLHDQGFPSIGCECCTRAVAPGEDIRAGRWWWESPEHKECGLHIKSGADAAGAAERGDHPSERSPQAEES